jgi:fido (protein-threonine AMPylation protein)
MDIFNKAIRAAALIKLYQPFRDGNNRTGIIVFGNIISEKAYIFDYACALYDSKVGKLKIPTIFDKNDIVSFPSTWNEYISKHKKQSEINIKQMRY